MSLVQADLGTFVGRPETSTHPALSRKHARQWWWRVYDRETYECPDCGRGADRVHEFDVHHKDGDPTNNDPENLVAICSRCHTWRHRTGPTISGLDVEEWKREFLSSGKQSLIDYTVYDHE